MSSDNNPSPPSNGGDEVAQPSVVVNKSGSGTNPANQVVETPRIAMSPTVEIQLSHDFVKESLHKNED